MKRLSLWLVLLVALLSSCGKRGRSLPESGGKPFEVLVVGDRDSVLTRGLEVDAEGLPQPEPSFDVSRVSPGKWTGALRLARAIVIYDTLHTLDVRMDRHAAPQVIIRTDGSDAARLRALLRDFERRVATARLRDRHNPKAEDSIRRQFGVRLLIPSDMTASKQGRDFLWLSNNTASGMRNICVYRGTNRDSVMRVNIKGETDSMYVQTVPGTVRRRQLKDVLLTYGLWEMRGDAMGGPFVSMTRGGVTAEAFVYAPEMKKRNLMRQLEAVVYTLETK